MSLLPPQGAALACTLSSGFFSSSLAALLSVWARPGKLAGRLIWSLVVFVPFLGPLIYAAIVIMYPPSPTPVSAPVNENVMHVRRRFG